MPQSLGSVSGKGGSAGIWFAKPGQTVNAQVYRELLKEKLLPFIEIHQVQHFLQDGAPYHAAKSVQIWLRDSNISVIGPWPGSSPDLNPIENLWVSMKRRVAQRNPTSSDELIACVKDVWVKEINPELCKTLARSMPRRIAAVLAAKGLHTKY